MRTAILEGGLCEPALTHWLEAAGHSVEPFIDLSALLRALPSQSFDVLVLGDWPAMSGPDLIRQIRRFSPITTVFLSFRHQEEDVVNTLRAGADDYLIKPLRRWELLARLESTTRHLREQLKPRSFEAHGLRVEYETGRSCATTCLYV